MMIHFGSPFELLLALLVAHALCDYPLQGDFLAKAKNPTAPIPGVPWYQALVAHALIQAGAGDLVKTVIDVAELTARVAANPPRVFLDRSMDEGKILCESIDEKELGVAHACRVTVYVMHPNTWRQVEVAAWNYYAIRPTWKAEELSSDRHNALAQTADVGVVHHHHFMYVDTRAVEKIMLRDQPNDAETVTG